MQQSAAGNGTPAMRIFLERSRCRMCTCISGRRVPSSSRCNIIFVLRAREHGMSARNVSLRCARRAGSLTRTLGRTRNYFQHMSYRVCARYPRETIFQWFGIENAIKTTFFIYFYRYRRRSILARYIYISKNNVIRLSKCKLYMPITIVCTRFCSSCSLHRQGCHTINIKIYSLI